ncbi:MAG: hypothetical protein WAL04_19245 [Acidimicrobiales bacterium]
MTFVGPRRSVIDIAQAVRGVEDTSRAIHGVTFVGPRRSVIDIAHVVGTVLTRIVWCLTVADVEEACATNPNVAPSASIAVETVNMARFSNLSPVLPFCLLAELLIEMLLFVFSASLCGGVS